MPILVDDGFGKHCSHNDNHRHAGTGHFNHHIEHFPKDNWPRHYDLRSKNAARRFCEVVSGQFSQLSMYFWRTLLRAADGPETWNPAHL